MFIFWVKKGKNMKQTILIHCLENTFLSWCGLIEKLYNIIFPFLNFKNVKLKIFKLYFKASMD